MMNRWGAPAGVLSLAMLVAGCAGRSGTGSVRILGPEPGVADATPVPAGVEEAGAEPMVLREPAGDPFAAAAPADAELASAVTAARAAWEIGRARFREHDMDRAREAFDRAIELLSTGRVADRPEAQDLAEAVASQVAAYESAWADAMALAGERDVAEEPGPLETVLEIDLPLEVTEGRPAAEEPTSRLAHDVPLVVNNQVTYMLELYKTRLKDEIEAAFIRSGRYLPMIQEVFREEGLPQDLAWLALVESGFKPHAYSRASAKGLWQFIRSTGRMYGLDADFWVDERADPIKSTRAAARHLRDLHERYGDWYLVLAAYNAGSGKVDRGIARIGKKDYWALAESRHLARETRNYVPAFLATLLIADDPAEHGFDFTPELPWTYEEVDVEGPVELSVLAECAGTSEQELRRLNPELRRSVTPGDAASYRLRIPLGTSGKFQVAWAEVPPEKRLRFATHVVRRGETLSRIAGRYGVTVDAIAAANGLPSRRIIPVGLNLRVPLSEGYVARSASLAGDDEPERAPRKRGRSPWHTVRRGDTLSALASRYGVSVAELRQWNGLGSSSLIRVGSRLKVGGGGPARVSQRAASRRSSSVRHRVRRGDTLWDIAGQYGVTVQDLVRWNGNRVSRVLRPGQTLKVFTN